MRILSCYIENYGRLHGLSLSFSDGMNQILAENGSGKTTLISFFRAILYGLPAGTKTNPQENERRHYTPWQGGRFGGSLTFSHNGKTYTAVRYFGEKESQDSFELYDTKTQLASKDLPAALGEALFGVDSDSFLKSVCVPAYERDPFSSRGATVTERLANAIESDRGAVSYEEAEKTLEKQRKVYIKVGNKGLLPETEAQIQAVTLRRLQAERDRDRAAIFENELAALQKEKAGLLAKDEILTQEILALGKEESGAALYRYGEGLKKSASDSALALSELRRSFGADVPDAATLKSATDAAYRLNEAPPLPSPLSAEEEAELLSLDRRFGAKVPSEDTILDMARTSHGTAAPHGRRAPWLPLFLLLLIPTAFLWIFEPLLSVGCGFFALAALVLFLGGRGKQASADDRDFLSAVSELTSLAERYKSLRNKREEGIRKIEEERLRRESETARLLAYAASYGQTEGSLFEVYRTLESRYLRYTQLLTEAKNAEAAYLSFQSEHKGTPPVSSVSPVSSADKERERAALRRRLEELDRSLDEKRRQFLPIRESIARIDEYRAEEARLEEKASTYRRAAFAIENAEKLLLLAKNSLASRYLSDMQARYEGYLSRFAPHLAEKAVLAADLSLKMKSGSARLSPLYMSDGIQDVLAFSMHMALADALFSDARPPLFLDDPFSLWDDPKTAAGLSFLSEESGHRQVFYFTCRSSRLSGDVPTLSLS